MHEFSPSKVPAFTAAEAFYVSAMDAISNDQRANRSRTDMRGRQQSDVYDTSSCSSARDSVVVTTSVNKFDEDDCNDGEAEITYDDELRTPTRTIGTQKSRMDLNATSDHCPPPPPITKQTDTGKWDFEAISQRGMIKTSSGNLFEAPSKLTRSMSSMQLDAASQFQSGHWKDDDVFDGPRSETVYTFATPKVSRTGTEESDGSPTPKSSAFNKSGPATPFPLFDHALASVFFSPPQNLKFNHEDRYATHAQALKSQIRTQLNGVRKAKGEVIAAQAERVRQRALKRASAAPTKLPQSRSFWSFKDPQVESAERTERIEKGRSRGWARERFNPEKYIKLSEEALAELRGTDSFEDSS